MQAARKDLETLEKRFWQSLVDEDTDTALSMLAEPSLMVSSHGTMQFDHAAYREMAEKGDMVVKSFKLSDMNVVFPNDDTAIVTYRVKQSVAQRDQAKKAGQKATQQEMADSSVWTRQGGDWRCVMHTETPVSSERH
jgi:hypothetical protein